MVVHHGKLHPDVNHMEFCKIFGVGLVVKPNFYGWFRRNAQYGL
jgi:hypothetical protein